MGKLQSIELYNFKSYRGIQRAEFGTAHFTSIIGPNGSGKSNMMDAISFVLGIRSKDLRSNHAKDLIYRNRIMEEDNELSDDEDQRQNGRQNGNAKKDPHKAYVKAVYVNNDGDVMELKRAVDNHGRSLYYINDNRMSYEDYENALAEENILIKAKNFLVFQGDVDNIAAQDPKSLCKLFEEVSGAAEYRQEYDQLMTDKTQEASRQSALNQDKKRCAQDVKHLSEQKQETEKFQRKIQEREDLLQRHLLWRLYHCETRAEEKHEAYNASLKEIKKAEKELKQHKGELDSVRSTHASSKNKAMKVEQKVKRQAKEIEDAKRDMVPLDARISRVETKISSEEKRREQIEREREKHDRDVKRHERAIEASDRTLAQFEKEVASRLKEGFNVTEQDMEEFQKLKDSYMSRTATEQSQMATVLRQQHSSEDELRQLEGSQSQLTEKLDQLTAELENQRLRQSELTSAVNDDNTSRAAKKNELDRISEDERQRKQEWEKFNEQLYKTMQKLADYDAVQNESHRERALRENGNALKRYIPGVHGFVHDLVDAEQEKYRTAVSTVLGRHMNSIIVDTFRTGNECIAYLKDNRMPAISFIPLDTINVKPIRGEYRGIAKGARLAIETVKFPEEVEAAVRHVCGDTIICDSLEIAKHVRWTKRAEVKTVSIDGSVIHKSNLMTGGTTNAQSWSDSDIRRLRNLRDDLQQKIDKNVSSAIGNNVEAKLNSELVSLQAKLDTNRNLLSQVKEIVNSREQEVKHCKQQLSQLSPQIETARQRVEQSKQEYNNIESSIENVQQDIFGEFCQRLGVDNFKQFDDNQSSAQQKVTQERTRHEQQLQRLNQLLEASKTSLEEQKARLERKERTINEDRRNLGLLKEEKQELESRLEQMEAKKSELEAEGEQFKTEIEANNRSTKEYKDRVDAAEGQAEKARQAAESLKQEMQSFVTNRVNILRDARMEGADLPLLEGSLENVSLDMNAIEPQDEDGDIKMDQDQSYGVVIDYSNLDDDLKEDGDSEVGDRLVKEAEEMALEMENIRQKVDLHAGDKLKEKKQRLKELENEFTAMQQRTKEANARFNEVHNKRRDKFMEGFNHISETITSIYKELTSSSNVPNGGTASMYVESADEPWNGGVNYGAMPPLKRYQPMELLSGGEKTMAAMALLFAIHSFQPSPFFVLDEIDAALDNVNVASIARYIKQHCGDSFQFIVISLKQGLFEHSESLVGIHRNQVENSSKALMLDLRPFDSNDA